MVCGLAPNAPMRAKWPEEAEERTEAEERMEAEERRTLASGFRREA